MLIRVWPMSQTTMPATRTARRGPRCARRPGSPHRRREEEREHQQRADQAELLADDGEDEVGVRLGQFAPFLQAGADARPNQPPVASA